MFLFQTLDRHSGKGMHHLEKIRMTGASPGFGKTQLIASHNTSLTFVSTSLFGTRAPSLAVVNAGQSKAYKELELCEKE